MFVMYRSPGKTAKWLLGVGERVKGQECPPEVDTLKRKLQTACKTFEIKCRVEFCPYTGNRRYKIPEPAAKDWFEKRYQLREAICAYSI
jgi:hypothetical protein